MPADPRRGLFQQRLQQALVQKGWSQADLARYASAHHDISKSNVSEWITGKKIPGPLRLHAIAKALGVDPETLLPSRIVPGRASASSLQVVDAGAGNARLLLDREMPWSLATKILSMLDEQKQKGTK